MNAAASAVSAVSAASVFAFALPRLCSTSAGTPTPRSTPQLALPGAGLAGNGYLVHLIYAKIPTKRDK